MKQLRDRFLARAAARRRVDQRRRELGEAERVAGELRVEYLPALFPEYLQAEMQLKRDVLNEFVCVARVELGLAERVLAKLLEPRR